MKKHAALLLIVLMALNLAPSGAYASAYANAEQSSPPKSAYISGFVGHAQQYSLSCESRSAADWAAYWGVSINETEFLNRLPRSDNPNEGFVGNPNDPWGYIPPSSYGVHAEPVARLLRNYGLDAHAGENMSWEELQNEIAAGRPVIVWVIGSIWAGTPRDYEAEDGETVRVANNQHTMTLIGYDENSVQLADALTGYTVTHSIENFLTSWAVLGNMAVVGSGTQDQQPKPQQEAEQPAGGDAYTVQAGDTLNKVAARLQLHWVDLAAWNHISYPYTIFPGQQLTLRPDEGSQQPPAASEETYTVQRGDHLLKIARELDLDWEELAALNELTAPYLLYPGQVLQLPASGEPAEEASEKIEVPDTYTATRSESLFALAHYYGLDWMRVAAANNIGFPFTLTAGETIRLK